ncbi:nuclear-pore anchor-like [Dorcoceras hygrometricum]|uniref:Nuclear-pore anchor-like n=1 Tax=Dorcoceras hygrometricum TaxID=472368 RepID=A0A2Z7D5I4_9LAMI|nr:nuclear-pore anchor-like [Dorcoceras hygrometricum]
MAPFVPRTRAVAVLRMKKIALDNQSRTIRRLRAKLEIKRRESTAIKKGLEDKVSSLERELQLQRCDNHSLRNTMTLYHKDIDRRISQLVKAKKEHKSNQVALEASHTTIAGLAEIGLCMSKKIEKMKAKKQQARESHMECHQRLQARIQLTESTIQEQQLTIETLMEENAGLLQTIQGLQEDNVVPFDDEWEEESDEEGLEEIPVGEGEIFNE